MTVQYVFKGDSIASGPFDSDEAAWNAQRELLEQSEPDEWDTIRRGKEWVVTEHEDNGTIYFRNTIKDVTAGLENGHDGWNAALTDDRNGGRVIEGSEQWGVSKPRAMCHLLAIVTHVDEYLKAVRDGEVSAE